MKSLCEGLYRGDGTVPELRGVVFQVGVGSGTTYYDVYKQGLKYWLGATSFWNAMNNYVRWYYYEDYASPENFIVSGANVATRSEHLQNYAFHAYNFAHTHRSAYPTAWSVLSDRLFASLGTAFWQSDAYGGTQIAHSSMQTLACLQVYSNRLYAQNATWHYAPAGRLGFAWHDGPVDDPTGHWQTLADRLAHSIHEGYGDNGKPLPCCAPSGQYTWCNGDNYKPPPTGTTLVPGSFVNGWASFG